MKATPRWQQRNHDQREGDTATAMMKPQPTQRWHCDSNDETVTNTKATPQRQQWNHDKHEGDTTTATTKLRQCDSEGTAMTWWQRQHHDCHRQMMSLLYAYSQNWCTLVTWWECSDCLHDKVRDRFCLCGGCSWMMDEEQPHLLY